MAISRGRCWSGEHLPLGILAIGALIVVVMGLPLFTLVVWHRHARDADFEAVEESSNKLQQQIFHRGDYEVQFYWVRHAGWAVLVLIGILDTFCPVWPKFSQRSQQRNASVPCGECRPRSGAMWASQS